MNLPQSLLEAVKQRKLVVFVGPEVSADLKNTAGKTLGSPTHQLDEMIHHLVKRASNVNFLYQVLEERGPEAVLNEIEKSPHVSRLDVHDFLREYMQLSAENDFSLHQKIAQLSHLVVTTTLDKAFETCSPLLNANVVSYGKNVEGAKVYIGQPVLFKLFGDVAGTTPVVVLPSDCERFYENKTIHSGLAMELLEELTRGKTILFIGCKPDDFQLRSIFRAIDDKKEQHVLPHFILTSEPEGWSADFLHPMVVENRSALEAVIDELIAVKTQITSGTNALERMMQKRRKEIEEYLSHTDESKNDIALKLLDEAIECVLAFDLKSAPEKWEQLSAIAPCSAVFAQWGVSLGTLAVFGSDDVSVAKCRLAIDKFEMAINLNPNDENTYCQYGMFLEKRSFSLEEEQKDEWRGRAVDQYKAALAINPDCLAALESWGNLLMYCFDFKSIRAVPAVGRKMVEIFERATLLNPHESDYHHALAIGIYLTLGYRDADAKDYSFDRCIKHLEVATSLHSDFSEYYQTWGYILADHAEYLPQKEQYTMFNQAFDKYKIAAELHPEYPPIYYHWGTYLMEYGLAMRGDLEEPAILEACAKFQKATELKPDYHQAYESWASALSELSRIQGKEDDEATQLEIEAKMLLSYEHGGESWPLATWYCSRKDKKKALKYLEISLQRKEITSIDICNDIGNGYLENEEEYKQLIKKYIL